MQETIFDKLIKNEIPNWKVWENDDYLAFLTPFGNTYGATVVIPKENPGQWAFEIDHDIYIGLMAAAREVAQILEKVFGTKVALVLEGTAVSHVHAKLYPMHNLFEVIDGVHAPEPVFFEEYQGYVVTRSGPKMDDTKLDELQKRILTEVSEGNRPE